MVRFILVISLLAFIGVLIPLLRNRPEESQTVATAQIVSSTSDDKFTMTDTELKKRLSKELFNVARRNGTEPPFSGEYNSFFEVGLYECAVCGNELFSSESKFNSKSGWPSFDKSLGKESLREIKDHSYGMERTEIRCAHCDSHLGHVFDDGPQDTTGLRYCINSVSLRHVPRTSVAK